MNSNQESEGVNVIESLNQPNENNRQRLIGTLTFHEAINYGAVLQAFALQQAIISLGCESEVINYSCDAIKQSYRMHPSFKSTIGYILRTSARMQRNHKFHDFISNHIQLSRPVNQEGLAALSNRYDSIIVGSDQVWNPRLTGDDRTYLLGFAAKEKRNAYAASIGLREWGKSFESDYKKAVSQFRKVTVREQTAVDYLKEVAEIEAEVVCDPTFLLTKKEWETIAIKPHIKEPYVLLYCFGKPDTDCLEWSKKQAHKLNAKLVCLNFAALPVPGVINVRGAGPAEFLGLIKNAVLVVTHSFHGCCFSIIFERNFCWFRSQEESANLKGRASRLEDLLTYFGLQDSIAYSNTTLLSQIDYEAVSKIVKQYRAGSLKALSLML